MNVNFYFPLKGVGEWCKISATQYTVSIDEVAVAYDFSTSGTGWCQNSNGFPNANFADNSTVKGIMKDSVCELTINKSCDVVNKDVIYNYSDDNGQNFEGTPQITNFQLISPTQKSVPAQPIIISKEDGKGYKIMNIGGLNAPNTVVLTTTGESTTVEQVVSIDIHCPYKVFSYKYPNFAASFHDNNIMELEGDANALNSPYLDLYPINSSVSGIQSIGLDSEMNPAIIDDIENHNAIYGMEFICSMNTDDNEILSTAWNKIDCLN